MQRLLKMMMGRNSGNTSGESMERARTFPRQPTSDRRYTSLREKQIYPPSLPDMLANSCLVVSSHRHLKVKAETIVKYNGH